VALTDNVNAPVRAAIARMYFSILMSGSVQIRPRSIGQANPFSEVYGCYNAKSQTIEGVFIKKFAKIFIIAELVLNHR
jgi:hypothetical protein